MNSKGSGSESQKIWPYEAQAELEQNISEELKDHQPTCMSETRIWISLSVTWRTSSTRQLIPLRTHTKLKKKNSRGGWSVGLQAGMLQT